MIRDQDWVYCPKCGSTGDQEIGSPTHFLFWCPNGHKELIRDQEQRGSAHTRDYGEEFPYIVSKCFAVSGEFDAT